MPTTAGRGASFTSILVLGLGLGTACSGNQAAADAGPPAPGLPCGTFIPAPLAADCTFALSPPPPGGLGIAPARIDVYANGKLVPWDTAHLDGWDAVDATDTVGRIYGPTCTDASDGGVVSLVIDYRCGPLN